jgi:hypothetical protein
MSTKHHISPNEIDTGSRKGATTMAGTALREASRLFNLMRAREIQRTAQHTLDDIATRFPAHLIDDVNARGLPPDRMLSALERKPANVRSFKNTNGSYKIYSLD